MKGKTVDTIKFLQQWLEKGPWVLVAIRPDKASIIANTFNYNTREEMHKWIEEKNGTYNLYFHVNPTIAVMTRKAKSSEIANLSWLHIDIDPDENISQKEILEKLQNPPAGIPHPTVIVFSGGGYQGFWKLQKPFAINGQEKKAEEAKLWNLQLERAFNADSCHNVDRIMRLPGTVNVPDFRKRKKGREKALAKLIEFNDTVFDLGKFKKAPMIQTGEKGFTSTELNISGNLEKLNSVDDLSQWGVDDRCKVIIAQGMHPDEPPKTPDNSRSAWLFDCVCGMIRVGVPDEVILSVITDKEFQIAASVLEKGSNANHYAIRQIVRAKEQLIDPMLPVLNETHAVISNMGGRCKVIEEVFDHAMGRPRLTKQSFEDIRNRYLNKFVNIGSLEKPKLVPLGRWWLEHPMRRQYNTIVFSPGKEIPDAYNLWRGFKYEPLPGHGHASFLKHILDNICSGYEEYYNYLVSWMARAVQKPASPGQTAVVLRGKQGTGKSFFVRHFGELFGRHFLPVSDPKHLVGSFNAHLRDCVILFGDEAFYAGDKKHESVLKMLITEELITIEAKGIDAEAAPNCTHVLLASNNSWVVPAGAEERRFFVLDVADTQMQKHNYFKKVRDDLDEGGFNNLLHFLMNYDLSAFAVRSVPKTDALNEQKLLSLKPEEEWWFNKLLDGKLLKKHTGWNIEVTKDEIYDDYIRAVAATGIIRKLAPTVFGRFLRQVCPENFPKSTQKLIDIAVEGQTQTVKRRPYFYRFPHVKLCRQVWDHKFQTKQKWPELEIEPEEDIL